MVIVVVAVVTIILRFFPFIIFNNKRKTPKIITYLGNILPFSVMAMLVIYCYKDLTFVSYPYGIPELIAGIIVILLHFWKKNTLLVLLPALLFIWF